MAKIAINAMKFAVVFSPVVGVVFAIGGFARLGDIARIGAGF